MDIVTSYLGLFSAAFLAATILPGSSEAVLIALLLGGRGDPVALLVVATAGNTAGAILNWGLGRWLLRYAGRRWFPVTREQLDRAGTWFQRYGAWSLLLSWVPVIGDPLTVVAGTLRMSFLPFVILVGIGKAARYGIVIAGAEAIRSL
ncbi:YqaA family protein [Inquilinus sp. Marseille-Q2685]|uniref:YqaA family protein n=1 Tax=Inquilinus sp. Marseille-Q2685 TaxID=2866581 RepID=UPI001CE3F6D4|nr:YqaA family protein [Inquilinus sp. Marseille-Q2685]